MTTCTITFSAVDTALQIKPAATLIFEPTPKVIRGVGATVMTPDTARVVANASGAGSIALVPGAYRLTMDATGGSRQVDIMVPDAATALLGDLIDTPVGEWEFSALQALRTDVTTAAGQVATDRGAVAADRVLTETARAAAVAAAPVATGAAAQAVVSAGQAAVYAGTFGPGMLLHRPDETIPAGWWDTGLRQSATSELWGNTATLALISNWTTSSLYTGGIATAFFDFTTVAREFQDVLGTPLTAAGQSVGMVRDAITPLTFGPNLVTNGSFDADTNWTKGTGWTIASQQASKAAGSAASLTQVIAVTAGRTYRIAGSAIVLDGTLTPRLIGGGTASGAAITTSGAFERYVTAIAGPAILDLQGSATFAGSVDNLTVQEVLGVVATQPSASLRGIWGQWPVTGRRNLLLWSENPTQSSWANISASSAPAAPVLGYPLFTLTTNTDVATSNLQGRVQQSLSLAAGQYTWTNVQGANADGIITMAVTASAPAAVGGSAGTKLVTFNTGTQQFTTQNLGAGGTYAAQSLGSGLWRITLSLAVTAAGSIFFQRAVDAVTTAGVSGGRSLLVGPMQVEMGASATPYQRVDTADYVLEAGARAAGFWRSDLVDDALTFNLPAAVDGRLFLLGRDGSWIEDRPAALGAQVTIGGTGAGTLATPGILRATGPLVAIGFRQGAFTADEWLRLKRRWRAEGARGELIVGPEMVVGGDFSNPANWTAAPTGTGVTTVAGGVATLTGTSSTNRGGLRQAAGLTVGAWYLVQLTATRRSGSIVLLGSAVGSGGQDIGASTGAVRRVVQAAASDLIIYTTSAGADYDIDNLSVRALTPEW